MGTPTRFTRGLTTVDQTQIFGNYLYPAPFDTGSRSGVGSVRYENDFDTLIGTDYTVTGTSSTFALGNVVGGVGVLTPGGATTASSAYKNGQFLQFQSGNQFWYVARFEVSALATGVSAYVGLQAGSSTNDGIWFAVSQTGAVSLVSTVGGVATTLVSSTVLGSITAATFAEYGFYYDGLDLKVFANNVMVARVAAPTIGASGTNLTNVVLGPVFQITPTATQTMTVDYVGAAQELTRV